MKTYKVTGKVKKFDMDAAWYYIDVPITISEELMGKTFKGMMPIEVTINKTTWKTSLLPKGDKTHFIALKASVRKKENLDLGDTVTVSFKPQI